MQISFIRTALIASLAVVVCQPSQIRAQAGQDGPASVTYGNTYQKGELKIAAYDLSTMPPLPAGYEALNNRAYLITTTAIVSGPHVIQFSTPSITDEETFKRLRVFHAEPDTFDPESPVWKDRTLLTATDHAPSFGTKSVPASCDDLGVFVIGKLVREIPPSTATADLSVSSKAALNRITAPDSVIYTVQVLNKGPDTATNIGLIDSLSGPVSFLSWEPSQGKCKKGIGHFYCKLGSLKAGETATITVKLNPDEGKGSFPEEGAKVWNSVFAMAQENDPQTENNRSVDRVLILADPNLAPSVTLTSPKESEVYVGPADITLEAIATDDRGVERVEFYDNGRSVGLGTSTDGRKFILVMRGVSFGRHRFWAIATDSGGRWNNSPSALVIVNGAAKIKVDSPSGGSLVEPASDLILNAKVTHASGLITRVEVFANDERLGEASAVGEAKYRLTWKSIPRSVYSVVFVVTDGSKARPIAGVMSKGPVNT